VSGSVPIGPIVDKDGAPTEAMRQLLQALCDSTGYPFEFRLKRISDTSIKVRLKGADGVWRESAPIALA
jgi:hypothetical protein